jgi:hypothetical protein
MGLEHNENSTRHVRTVGSHVSNARAYVPKAADVRVIMGLQDVGAGGAFNVCKTCGQVAIVRLHCCANAIDHSQVTATVLTQLDGAVPYRRLSAA